MRLEAFLKWLQKYGKGCGMWVQWRKRVWKCGVIGTGSPSVSAAVFVISL